MQVTTNHSVAHATTIRRLTMAAVVGVGRSESLALGDGERLGQSCAFTREIKQGRGWWHECRAAIKTNRAQDADWRRGHLLGRVIHATKIAQNHFGFERFS